MDDQDREDIKRYIDGIRADAWAEFVLDGSPSALAEYMEPSILADRLEPSEMAEFIKNECKLEGQAREAVVDILRNGPSRNAGGRKLWRDFTTYVEIFGLELRSDSTLRQVQIEYAEKTNQELRTVQKQYQRGRQIYGK